MRNLPSKTLLMWMKNSIPPLDAIKYKGNSGKICVIGGSKEYTGAPYFSAISALLCGADLVHVICPQDAAPIIKSYSPELIVHPILGTNRDECCKWLDKMHAVIIGPGLGRDNVQESMDLIRYVKTQDIPLIVDADGLYLVCLDPSIISGYKKAILTPNINEAKMLFEKITKGTNFNFDMSVCSQIAFSLGNITIVAKGIHDMITDGTKDAICDIRGSPRRCGGQGDLLSGTMGLMLSWCYRSRTFIEQSDNFGCEAITAAFNACTLTRICSRMAFAEKQRAMITSDMIGMIGKSFTVLSNLEPS